MIGVVRGVLCTLLVGTGCHEAFDLTRVEPADAMLRGELPAFCKNPEVFDAFDGSTPCAFGATFGDASLAVANGLLSIEISPAGSGAGCTAFRPYPFSDRGAFVRVVDLLELPTGFTMLKVRNSDGTQPSLDAYLIVKDGSFGFYVDGARVAERSDAPEWWRIRQPEGTRLVAVELSSDGIAWEPWVEHEVAALPASIAVDFAAGVDNIPSASDTASFSAFGICM